MVYRNAAFVTVLLLVGAVLIASLQERRMTAQKSFTPAPTLVKFENRCSQGMIGLRAYARSIR